MASLGGPGADRPGWHPPGGWHPKDKNCGQIDKEKRGDTRVKAIKSEGYSDSDEQKHGRQVFQEKIEGCHPQLPPRVSPTLVTPLPETK